MINPCSQDNIVMKHITGKMKAFLSSQDKLLDENCDGTYARQKMRRQTGSVQ